MYYYCTKDKRLIADMAFDMFDIDDDQRLSDRELKNMVSSIYGAKAVHQDINKLLKIIDRKSEAEVTRKEFCDAAHNFPALLFPAFHTQVDSNMQIIHSLFFVL